MKRSAIALACAMGIGITGCGSKPKSGSAEYPTKANTQIQPEIISGADADYTKGQFDKYATYWQGLGKIAADTHLVLLSGYDTFDCYEPAGIPSHTATSLHLGEYCVGGDTVVITGIDINAAMHVGSGKSEITFTNAHELGHAIQNGKGELTASSLAPDKVALTEEQATCYAGTAVARLDPEYVQQIDQLLLDTPILPDHGSSQGQAAAFMNGVHTGNC